MAIAPHIRRKMAEDAAAAAAITGATTAATAEVITVTTGKEQLSKPAHAAKLARATHTQAFWSPIQNSELTARSSDSAGAAAVAQKHMGNDSKTSNSSDGVMDRSQAFAKKRYANTSLAGGYRCIDRDSHRDAAMKSGNPGADHGCYHQNTKPGVDTKAVEDDDWVAINEDDIDEVEYDFCGCAEKD